MIGWPLAESLSS